PRGARAATSHSSQGAREASRGGGGVGGQRGVRTPGPTWVAKPLLLIPRSKVRMLQGLYSPRGKRACVRFPGRFADRSGKAVLIRTRAVRTRERRPTGGAPSRRRTSR